MEIMNIYYTQTVQFFKKEFCTINVHCLFFLVSFFLLFNDVDIPQVALLRAFFALAQKDKGQINDKINVYEYNACLGFLFLFLSFFFLQQNLLGFLYQLMFTFLRL